MFFRRNFIVLTDFYRSNRELHRHPNQYRDRISPSYDIGFPEYHAREMIKKRPSIGFYWQKMNFLGFPVHGISEIQCHDIEISCLCIGFVAFCIEDFSNLLVKNKFHLISCARYCGNPMSWVGDFLPMHWFGCLLH